jgi:hypothetical protein
VVANALKEVVQSQLQVLETKAILVVLKAVVLHGNLIKVAVELILVTAN